MGGLQNRFDNDEVKSFWAFHYECLICNENGWDALHHILSPTSQGFVKGKHNTSILNSCPIHNVKCHLYNPSLKRREKELLKIVLRLTKNKGYELNEKDIQFLTVYKKFYA